MNAFDQFDEPKANPFDQYDKPVKKQDRGFIGAAKDLGLGIGGAVVSAVGAIPSAAGRAVQEAGRDVFGMSQAEADALAKGDTKKSAEYLEKSNRFSPTELLGQGAQYLGRKLDAGGKYLQELRSLQAKEAAANGVITGDITNPSTWTAGKDPSVEGYVQNAANVVGSLAPMLATAVATRGKSLATQAKVGAAVGGAQVGGSAMSEAGETLQRMPEDELIKQSPVYVQLLASGMSATEARARLVRSAENMAGLQTAAIGAAGGAATGALLGKAAIGKTRLGAIGGTTAVSGVEEGTQEMLEGVSTRDAVNRATGMSKPLMDGTFGEFVMGAVGGGAVGAAKGATRALTPTVNAAVSADTVLDAEAAPPAQAAPLALPAPRVVVNERGQAIREGQSQVFDEPAARVQGRAEIIEAAPQSQIAQEMLALGYEPTPRALPTPVLVNSDGLAAVNGEQINTAQRNADIGLTQDVRDAQVARVQSQIQAELGRLTPQVTANTGQGATDAQQQTAPEQAPTQQAAASQAAPQQAPAQAATNAGVRPDSATTVEAANATPGVQASGVAPGVQATAIPTAQAVAPQPAAPKPAGGGNARRGAIERNPFMAFLGGNGVRLDTVKDFVPGAVEQRKAMVPGYGPVFRRSGMQLDMLAAKAVEEGYMQTEDVGKLYDMIGRAIGGERIAPVYSEGGASDMIDRRVAEYQSKQDDEADSQYDGQPSDYDDSVTASLTDAQLFVINDVNIGAPSNVSTEDAMRTLGFSEQDVKDAATQRPREQETNSQGSGQPNETTTKPADGEAAPRDAQAGAGDQFLQQPTRQELIAQDERGQKVEREQAAAQRQTEQRANADAQRDGFTLTGSDRAADADPSQQVMFSNRPTDTQFTQETGNTLLDKKENPDISALKNALGNVDIQAVTPNAGSSFETLAKGVQKTFGKRVSYYQSSDPGAPSGGARIRGKKDVIYVNVESGMPKQIVGHEMLHDLRERHNDLYQALVAALRVRAKDTKANREDLERGYGHKITDDLTEEENLADVGGYAFESEEFWPMFAESLSQPQKKTFFRWIAEWLSSVIGKAKIDIQGEAGLREAAVAMRESVAKAYAEAVRRDRTVSSIKPDMELIASKQQDAELALQSGKTTDPLTVISETDEMFALPKSEKNTVEGIAADHDSEIKVRQVKIPGNEVMYTLTMPDGTIARITERTSTPDSVYGAVIDSDNNYTWIKERPGDNAESLPEGIKDVWIDVSNLKPGQNGGRVYSIAATYAYNTGAIFIGDPSGFSPAAMRRRPEQMLSSALKFGTTDHIAPHPDQVKGNKELGIPPLKWIYGDNFGNIERLVELNIATLDKAQPESKDLKYDLDTGLFFNESNGRGSARSDLANLYFREMLQKRASAANTTGSNSDRRPSDAGWRTFARGAVLRAILQRGRTAGDGGGRSATGRAILEGLVSQRDKLTSTAKEARIFYSNRKPNSDLKVKDDKPKSVSTIASKATKIVAPITAPLQAVNKATDKIGQELARLTGIEKLGKKVVSTVKNAVNLPSRWTWVERVKQGLVSDYGLTEEYLQQKIEKRSRENKQLREAASTLDRLSSMTPDELAVAYQWLQESPDTAREKELISRLKPEQQAVVKAMKDDIDRLSKEAVELGLISQETYERNKFAYVHRSYKKYEAELVPNQLAARQRAQKIKGDQFKGRGMEMPVALDRIENLPDDLLGVKVQMFEKRNADGKLVRRAYSVGGKAPDGYESAGTWEIRNAKGENATIWRDFTLAERQRMGEIEDARYGFAKTMLQGVRDIETARFLSWTAEEYGKASADGLNVVDIKPNLFATQTFTQDEWVKVPETKIKGTQVLRYGDLAGQHIPGVLWNDLVGTMEVKDSTWDKAVTAWKMSKTALSPGVHVNNVMSNFVMADLADVGVNDIRRALETILKSRAGDAKAKAIMERYEDSGAESGSFAANEIKSTAIEPLLKEIQQSEPEAVQKANLLHVLSLAVHGEVRQAAVAATKTLPGRAVAGTMEAMISAYQAEDSVFRLAKFVNEINAGKTDQQAGKAAREAFLDYNINAPWVRAARRTALPFISFTYRAVPLIAKTIVTKPWKLAKYTALGYALNGLAYTMLGEAGDEEKEKRLLPNEMQGNFIGLPKMVRLPWNSKDNHPMWLDARRWLPAGDVTETNQSKASVPLPSWLSIGGPLSLMVDFYSNTNFKGDKVVKATDTPGQMIEKSADMLMKFALPNIPSPGLGSIMRAVGAPVDSGNLDPYAWASIEKAMNNSKSRTGKESDVSLAVLNAFGVKAQSRSLTDELANVAGKYKAQEREIKMEITRLAGAGARNETPKPEAERRIAAEIEKLKKLAEKTADKMTKK